MTKAQSPITAMSRSNTVMVNGCSGSPRFCSPYRNIIRGTHTSASIVIHASRIRRCGSASTASGTSHSENCGLHTLLVNRNAATTRKATCTSRGRCAAVSATYVIATQHDTNITAVTVLSTVGGCQKPKFWSNPPQPVNDFTTLYSESMSSPRRVLSRKNSDHPRGNSTIIGRFTTSQASTVAIAVRPTSRSRPVRMPRSTNGTNSSSGYSLAATPSPSSAPASHGFRRAQANSAPVAKAVAGASKFVKAWKIRIGDAATNAASQIRREPASCAVAHTVASHASANPNAAMLKNITTSAMTGTDTSLVSAVYVLANAIDRYW